jgi:hypothetical protein
MGFLRRLLEGGSNSPGQDRPGAWSSGRPGCAMAWKSNYTRGGKTSKS